MKEESLFRYQTLDVFADRPFGGNPLAVFLDAGGLSDRDMQSLAAEMNYSETTFVIPPDDPAHDARVRIFHRTAEMPFAGHPNVGTAFVLGRALGDTRDRLIFEEIAGIVEARLIRAGGKVVGAEIDAPSDLFIHDELPPADIASCLSLQERDVVLSTHAPVRAGVGVDFVLAEVSDDALRRASPDRGVFERVAAAHPGSDASRLSLFLYCQSRHQQLRARMFAPLAGTWEDPATGSAHAALAALLLHLDPSRPNLSYEASQGIELGRASRLSLKAWRIGNKVRASVGGLCTPMFEGEFRRH